MNTRREMELVTEIVLILNREKLGIYEALRVLGYAAVAAAEGLPLQGDLGYKDIPCPPKTP